MNTASTCRSQCISAEPASHDRPLVPALAVVRPFGPRKPVALTNSARVAAVMLRHRLGGQGKPLNSGCAPGVGSVNRQPKNGDATACGRRMLSPAGRLPVAIHDTSAENPADSSLVV